jgi:hypothetical protein
MPPVVAVVAALTAVEVVTIGVAVISAVDTALQIRKNAKKMEEEMRRQEESQREYEEQQSTESAFAGGGGISYEPEIREDSKLMLKSAKAPRNVVFGRDRTSGPMACFFSFEENNVLFHRFAVVLAGHESDAIESIWFDDDELTLDAYSNVIAPAKYTDNGRPLFIVNNFLGGSSQQSSTMLMDGASKAGDASAWDGSRLGIGVTYVAIQMEANYDALAKIGIPNVSAVIRGVKAYDPRNLATYWTQNPALLARWWLVDSIYSPATDSSEIDDVELIASANVCEEIVTFQPGSTDFRYTANGSLNTNSNPLGNLEKIVSAMDGDLIWIGGKWQIIAGYYKVPTLHIDESSLSNGQISISPYAPTAQLINAISGQCKGPTTKYQAVGYPMVTKAEYQDEDGGQIFERKDDFDLSNYPIRCQKIAGQRLNRARKQLTLTLDCNLKAYNTSPLQNVTVSLAEFGFVNKVFTVRRRQFSGSHIEYTLQETDATTWVWDTLNTDFNNLPISTNITISSSPTPLTGLAATSGSDSLLKNKDGTITSRIKLTWDLASSHYVRDGGRIDVQYRIMTPSTGEWINAVPISGDQTTAYLDPVIDSSTYEIRGRTVNQVGSRGVWSDSLTHVVIGKTEPPSDITGFGVDDDVLSWIWPDDVDLAGAEIRFNYGSNNDWWAATPLNAGLITETPFKLTTRPSGIVTFMVKAKDTTGNYSTNAPSITLNLGDPFIANVVSTYNFDPLFLGAITNGIISIGDLVCDASDSFYPADGQQFYQPDTSPFYGQSVYPEMIYETLDHYVSLALTGSIMTLDIDYVGSNLFIEYRFSNPLPFYSGGDDASLYGADSEEFYPGTGEWLPWPGQIKALNEVYQFRVTLGSDSVQTRINSMAVVIDAPDIVESINNLTVSASGTVITYTKPFTAILNIQTTLQANATGAITVEVDKTNPLAPVVKCYNSSHTAVSGAMVDIILKGY